MKNTIAASFSIKFLLTSIIIIVSGLFFLNNNFGKNYYAGDPVIIDSDITLAKALENITIPDSIKKNLVIVDVNYFSFDKRLHKGQLVIRKELAADIKAIFKEVEYSHFPVEKVIPIVKYNWSDDASMEDNNSSAFNYRTIKGSKVMSFHSKGQAIDINPLINPEIKHGEVSPAGGVYDTTKPGTITINSIVFKAFIKRGWQWGGQWHSYKDYQHFEKANVNDDNIAAKGNTVIPFKHAVIKAKKSIKKH